LPTSMVSSASASVQMPENSIVMVYLSFIQERTRNARDPAPWQPQAVRSIRVPGAPFPRGQAVVSRIIVRAHHCPSTRND
jgi:hypothetical protein